ncbi:tetratricopeptide repeat protein [Microbispora sp. RL4-1S]|uniref:Tetratricopeptide repeat protein n=1 Tax=Microbispora oryzae TaxID=2806554 RepID=A0A940WMH3_9ACTN|nr:tetratricopeptide repeat protein [Microbispora oryzae]MBP2708196.1 tetratricopeptide repeat protein [Microbispora oryzae]
MAGAVTDGKALTAVVGAALAGALGAFAPTVYDAAAARRRAMDEAASAAALTDLDAGPATLLTARRAVVEFTGRAEELRALEGWCADQAAARMRLVTGPGGVGKTRLMLELSARMHDRGWGVAEVGERQEATALERYRQASDGRVLLVVDYAETRTGLDALLASVVADQGKGVRLLLLARSVGEWWDRLGAGEPPVRKAHTRATVERMELASEVQPGLSEAQVVAAAAADFARVRHLARVPDIALVRGRGPARILDLHAAALVGVLEAEQAPGTGTLHVDLAEVLADLLGHERRFWLRSAEAAGLCAGPGGLTSGMLAQLVAAASLLGARDRSEAVALLERVPEVPRSGQVADWLRSLYPPDTDGAGVGEWLGGLRPDRLAELHVSRELAGSDELAQRCLRDLNTAQARQALIVLGRASVDYGPAAELLRQIVPLVARVAAELEAPRETLAAISAAIPYPSLALAEAHAIIARKGLDTFPAGERSGDRASWLATVGILTAQLGHPADALPAEQEALAIRRELAERHPDRYRPDLARSLSNLGVRFWELGHPADALPPTQQAVTIYRELAERDPDRYRPDLAASLSNLGVRFWELGHPADALSPAHQAVTIYQELAERHPDRYRPDLAASLTNLGIWFSELGHPADALPLTQQAVTIYQELAERHPDHHRPDLARALSNLGMQFSELSRPADALPPTQQAITIRRELAERYPDRYRPDLARSLSHLGVRFMELGRLADALPPAQQAVTIYRELAERHPDRYRPDLAACLTNIGITLALLERLDEALPLVRQGMDLWQDLANRDAQRFETRYAASVDLLRALTGEADDS